MEFSKNIVEFIIKSLIKIGGSVTAGCGSRFQPSFNNPIHRSIIYKGLRILREVVVDLNLGRYDPGNMNLLKRLSEIHGVGMLTAQHLICIGSLSGIIKDPRHCMWATISTSTTTFKNINETFALGETNLNKLISHVSTTLKITEVTVENAICEFVRDCKSMKEFLSMHMIKVSVREATNSLMFS